MYLKFIVKSNVLNNTSVKVINMLKRILAIIGLIIIALWIIATLIFAILPIPFKGVIFKFLIAGCVFLPIMLWLILWMVSVVTGKKNIASMHPESNSEAGEKEFSKSLSGNDPEVSGDENKDRDPSL